MEPEALYRTRLLTMPDQFAMVTFQVFLKNRSLIFTNPVSVPESAFRLRVALSFQEAMQKLQSRLARASTVALISRRVPVTPKLAMATFTAAEATTLAKPPAAPVSAATRGFTWPFTRIVTPPVSEAFTVSGTGPTMNVLDTEKKDRLQLMGVGAKLPTRLVLQIIALMAYSAALPLLQPPCCPQTVARPRTSSFWMLKAVPWTRPSVSASCFFAVVLVAGVAVMAALTL